MLGIDIFFLIAIILIFWKLSSAFTMQNPDEGIGTRQMAVLSTYGVSEKMLLFIDSVGIQAAYESIFTVSQGGSDVGCGTYSTYTQWSTPSKQCYPDVLKLYNKELKKNMINFLGAYPGMPQSIVYTFNTKISGATTISATTKDQITIPIISRLDGPQVTIESMLVSKEVSKISRSVFSPDTTLSVEVQPSQLGTDRSGSIQHIAIISKVAENLQQAANEYTNADFAAHYIIDRSGSIMQMIPEQKSAPFCEQDSCKKVADTAISISLINNGASSKSETCSEYTEEFSSMCWERFSDNQLDALTNLVADIAKRRGIKPENQLFFIESQALHKSDLIRSAWEDQFRKDVISRAAKPAVKQEVEVKINDPNSLQIGLPVNSPRLMSCYGNRALNGRTYHYGDDIVSDGGDKNIYAIMDGKVETANLLVVDSSGKQIVAGKYIVLSHAPSPLYSGYMHLDKLLVSKGDFVTKGQVIGIMGTTGNSSGVHLHLSIGENSDISHGNNPLCYYPSSLLQKFKFSSPLGSNCNYGTTSLTVDNLNLRETCGSVSALGSGSQLSTITAKPLTTSQQAGLQAVIKRLNAYPGFTEALQKAYEETNVDKELLIGQILRESSGVSDVITCDGGVGISQFTDIATSKKYFAGIADVNKINICKCSAEFCPSKEIKSWKNCKPAQVGCNLDDPRLTPALSVRAQAKYMAHNIEKFSQYSNKIAFAIAAYNTGESNMLASLEKAKSSTGSNDPSWDQVKPFLKVPSLTGPYTDDVLSYYVAQGGKLSIRSTVVSGAQIKDMGTYSFTPGFSVNIPATTSMQTAVDFVKETTGVCTGNGVPLSECVADQVKKFNSEYQDTLSIESCEEQGREISMQFTQFIQDCKYNLQNNCTCTWTPPKGNVAVRLFGDYGQIFVDQKETTE